MLALPHRFSYHGQSVAWGSAGQGPAMVLVHGFPWSAQVWRAFVPWLAKTHKVFYYDMLGSGQSAMDPAQPVTEAVQSDLLVALIEHWDLQHPHVVGHDFGGLAALRGHFIHGIQYGGLHLIDAVALLPSGSPFYAHVADHEPAFAGLPDYAHEALITAYIQQAAHHPLRLTAAQVYLEPWQGPVGKAAFYRQIAQADTAHIDAVQARYGKTDFDVHLIWGEEDRFIPIARGQALQQRLQAASFTTIPDAAHLVQEDAPEALMAAILQTLP